MSSHVITEAILGKTSFFGKKNTLERLQDDWNDYAEIYANGTKIGTIEKTFDLNAGIYPQGFSHDVTLIKPFQESTVESVKSPIVGLGWLSRECWFSLRQNTSAVNILSTNETHRSAKTLVANRPSDILVIGEGIFIDQTAAVGSKSLKDHDVSTWTNLVSRAILYRVTPDFDVPRGYSGIALYADGTREDGTSGPAVVGFQSFVQRSGHVQSFDMEGRALERRLSLGRIAFYRAFQVPDELRQEYEIVSTRTELVPEQPATSDPALNQVPPSGSRTTQNDETG